MFRRKVMIFMLTLLVFTNNFLVATYSEGIEMDGFESIFCDELIEVNNEMGILSEEEIELFKIIINDNLEIFNFFEDTFPRKHRLEILRMIIEEMGEMSPSVRKLGLTNNMAKKMLIDLIKDSIYDSSNIKTTEIDYTIASDKDYKILFLFDLQLENLLQTPEELKSRIYEENPNILILGGDIVNLESDIDILEDYLGNLDVDYKYYVRGNHEYYLTNSDLSRMEEILDSMGFIDINNTNVAHKGFNIIGIDDSNSEKDNVEKAYENLKENQLNIVVTHNHDINYELDKYNLPADIVLSGHTHGGQINSFLVPQRKNSKLWEEKGFYYGEYTFKGKTQNYRNYTANGLGGSRVPLRLGAQQEFLVVNIFSDGNYGKEKLPESIDAPIIETTKKNGLFNINIKNKPDNTRLVYSFDGENWNSDTFNLDTFSDGEYKIYFKYILENNENYMESDISVVEVFFQNNLFKNLKEKLENEIDKKIRQSNYREIKTLIKEIKKEMLELMDKEQRDILKEILLTLKDNVKKYEDFSYEASLRDYDRSDKKKKEPKREVKEDHKETLSKNFKEEIKEPEIILLNQMQYKTQIKMRKFISAFYIQ